MNYGMVVMKKNLDQLPELLKLLIDNNVKTWEVFFLDISKFVGNKTTGVNITIIGHEYYSISVPSVRNP